MNLLVVGSLLGISLGLIMILAFIVPALRERRRHRLDTTARPDDYGPSRHDKRGPAEDDKAGRDKAAMHAISLGREEIWNRGCRGEALGAAEAEEFNYLARARFHTFRLGIGHAQSNKDEKKSEALAQGMAVELFNAPGLERLWFDSPVSEDPYGQAVNARLMELRTRR